MGTNGLNTDKGEVGGSSPPRPTIQITSKYAAILTFPFPEISLTKLICQPFVNFSNGQAPGPSVHPRPLLLLRALLPNRNEAKTPSNQKPRVEGFLRVSATQMDYFRIAHSTAIDARPGVRTGRRHSDDEIHHRPATCASVTFRSLFPFVGAPRIRR